MRGRLEIVDVRPKHRFFYREERAAKQPRHQHAHVVRLSRANAEMLARNEARGEEGQPTDMIEMRVGQQDERLAVIRVFHQRVAKPPHAASTIEDDA